MNQADSTSLRPIQQQAISLLMQGKTQVEVAEILSVDRITVGRWIQRPEFNNALSGQVAELQEQVSDRLRQSQTKALDTIEALLDDLDSSDRTRLDAAKFVLDRAASLPPPQPPGDGVPCEEVIALLDSHMSTLNHQTCLMFELLGLGQASDWVAMSDFERVLWAIACESFATYIETGEIWKPAPDDLLITELRCLAKEHPDQVEATHRHITQTYYATEAETEGEEGDGQHPDPGGHVASPVEA